MSDIIHYPILTALFTLVSFVAMIWLIINARGVTASARAVWIAIILFVLGGFGAFLMLFLSGERQEIDAIDSRATLGAPYIPPAG